ncbi:DNA-binding protein [Alkalihalobacillus sp. LMS39]|uniref:DNA-binding protein n=1 Tax=Alkalihalobacillus sp. LMS39 TaxID=2924032 RepID=UPI001FB223AA|nr:DNA-binding protein [Alkalihalobacillus sp. LMS39]UOE95865.1 DNA-binding protein [Alkalihalobacillus sp. LMS39]
MNVTIGLISIGLGLALMGYFIGKGLQHFSRPETASKYNLLIKESDVPYYLNLSKGEVEDLLHKYPNVPRIELKGTTYYPYNQLMEWLSSNEFAD